MVDIETVVLAVSSEVFVFENPDMTTYMAMKKGGSGSTDALLRPPLRKSKSGSSLVKQLSSIW